MKYRIDSIPPRAKTSSGVGWRYITCGGKQTKAPVSPLGSGLADSTSVDTWGTFDQAVAACQSDKTLDGIGFVFTADDPYCGVDLDNCIDDQGKLGMTTTQTPHNPLEVEAESVPSTLRIVCDDATSIALQAADATEEGKPALRKFSMTAYTGGAMRLGG